MSKEILSGKEILLDIVKSKKPPAGMAEKINMYFTKVGDGTAEVEAILDHSTDNAMGAIHGGVYATLLDTAMGNSVYSKLNPGESFGTIELDVKLVKAIPHGKKMIAKGIVRIMSRQLVLSEGKLVDESGKLYGTGSCLCLIKS